jgi:hypothetical protein
MRALLVVLLAGLVACYSPRTLGQGTDGYVGAQGAAWDEPLRASLWIDPHSGFTSFDLNRPAHVALFRWQPGSHFSIVYPAIGYGTNQFFHAGRNVLHARAHVARDRGYRGVRTAAYDRSSLLSGPTYFVLIASEEPLRVHPFYGHAPWVTRVGWSNNLYTATDLLASQIVPSPGTTDYTVAYQVVWFEGDLMRPEAYRWVTCPDGTVIAVPFRLLRAGFPVCPDGTRPEPMPGDTSDVTPATPVERIGERVAALRERPAGLDGERADPAELREMIRRIHEARGNETDQVELPAAAWRRADRERAAARAATTTERPVIRPLVSRPTESAPVFTPMLPRAERDRRAADRPAALPERRTEPRPVRPARPETRRPSAAPPIERRSPPPPAARPVPQRPPTPPAERRPPPDDAA